MFDTSGVQDHHINVFIPRNPNKITQKVYLCGKRFITSTIEHLFIPEHLQHRFGLLMLHGESAIISTFTKSGHSIIKKFNKELASRHNKGGQSQNRHQRNHDIMVNNFNTFVSEDIIEAYTDDNGCPIVEGIVIVGTGDKRFSIIKKLPNVLQSIIIHNSTVKSKLVTPEEYLQLHSSKLIDNFLIKQQNKIFQDFLTELNVSSGDTTKAVYGIKEVNIQFNQGLLKSIIVHQSILDRKGPQIRKVAKKCGCKVHPINSNTEPGHQLLNNFGGVVGIKWY